MRGDPALVRIGAGAAGAEDFSCAASAAAKIRPGIVPVARMSSAPPQLETFALGPVMQALDRIEFDHTSLDTALAEIEQGGKRLHAGLAQFARHAVRAYLADSGPASEPELQPVQEWWVAQRIVGRTWELYAWGRRYQSPDGGLREFRFLRLGTAESRDRETAQIAIAAFAAAFGSPARWPARGAWAQPFRLQESAAVARVRVTDVGLADGSRTVHFDGTRTRLRSTSLRMAVSRSRGSPQAGRRRRAAGAPNANCWPGAPRCRASPVYSELQPRLVTAFFTMEAVKHRLARRQQVAAKPAPGARRDSRD
jgi:hypothetical protein